MTTIYGHAMEVLARPNRLPWEAGHPLHNGLQSLCQMADDGSLWQAFVASVRHLAVEKQLDLSVLHGDGTNTVAKKGAMALATRATNTRQERRSSP